MRPIDHLRDVRAFLVAIALLSLLALAHAQAQCDEWRVEGNPTLGVFTSGSSACEAAYAARGPGQPALNGREFHEDRPDGGTCYGRQEAPNDYLSAFAVVTKSLGACPPTGCAASAGTTREVNFTLGWTRTANADDYGFVGGQNSIPTSACHGGCTVGVLTAQRTWVSPTPSPDGLYRHSADLLVIGTDSSCSATTPAMESTAEDKACDGTVGYVNGKRTCVKASSAPDPVQPAPAPEKIGNPTAGSPPNPTDANNPAGREPTGGTGGNLGGPPSGASAGEPRGTGTGPATGGAGGAQTIKVEIPDLKDPCGIPGSPPCKIDESGTPNGEGAFGEAGDGIDDAKDQVIDLINGIKDSDGPPPWSWTFALPTGCSPIPITGFSPWLESIDICEFQPLFHDVMSVFWLLGTVGGCVTLLYRTLIGGT